MTMPLYMLMETNLVDSASQIPFTFKETTMISSDLETITDNS